MKNDTFARAQLALGPPAEDTRNDHAPSQRRASNETSRDATLARIARELLHLETLEVRNRDRLDFHDLSVAWLRNALEAAYEAGRASESSRRTRRSPR